jgi:hypothetical protein
MGREESLDGCGVARERRAGQLLISKRQGGQFRMALIPDNTSGKRV